MTLQIDLSAVVANWRALAALAPADDPGTPIIFDTTEFGSTDEFFWI